MTGRAARQISYLSPLDARSTAGHRAPRPFPSDAPSSFACTGPFQRCAGRRQGDLYPPFAGGGPIACPFVMATSFWHGTSSLCYDTISARRCASRIVRRIYGLAEVDQGGGAGHLSPVCEARSAFSFAHSFSFLACSRCSSFLFCLTRSICSSVAFLSQKPPGSSR